MADDPTLVWTWTNRGQDVAEFGNMIVAQRICQTYKLILDDALVLDPTLAHGCSRALLRSLWYFCLGPLKDVLMVPRGASAAKTNLENRWNVLYLALVRAEYQSRGLVAGREYVRGLNARMWVAIQISACSPLELLARICWKRNAFTTLGRFDCFSKAVIIQVGGFVLLSHNISLYIIADTSKSWGAS